MSGRRAGFTLVELLVVLTLLLPVGAAAVTLATTSWRAATRAGALAAAEATVVHTLRALEAELADVTPEGELLLIEPARIRLVAARGAGPLCRADSAGVVVSAAEWAATRLPVAGRDSLELERVAQDSAGSRAVVRLGLSGPPMVEDCAPGVAGLRLSADLSAVTLPGFAWGGLVRTVEVIELVGYMSGGETWFGIRHLGLGTPVEPVAGPFVAGGVQFTGLDGAGNPTGDITAIRAVRVRLETPAPQRVVRDVVVRAGG